MSEVPAATPVTIPVVEPMVALAVALLAHVPPDVISVKFVVDKTHAFITPEIAEGRGLTVTCAIL